ncbi:helix-turn-helix transcriptional regulator [Vibrio tapetis]
MGLSVKQIANKKAISEMAVNKHLKVARDKFDCQTSSELRTIYLCRVLRTISVNIPYATNLV